MIDNVVGVFGDTGTFVLILIAGLIEEHFEDFIKTWEEPFGN